MIKRILKSITYRNYKWRFKDFFIKPTKHELEIRKKILDYEYLCRRGVNTVIGNVKLIGMPCIEKAPNSNITIGKNVTLISEHTANTAGINHPVILSAEGPNSKILIGDGVGMSGTSIVTCSSIEIGNNTYIGANVNIYGTDFHCIEANQRLKQKSTADAPTAPIKIGNNCWIASNVTILKGVTIGDNAVIGAMSLVNKDVPANTVYAGVPAKFIRKI